MILSDLSITRPVFASVLSLLLVLFGIITFTQLPVREYPDVEPPVVSIETTYTGAAAVVVETTITQVIENSVAGIEGIKYIESRSRDGRSDITIEFEIGRDLDAAVNDVRDRVAAVVRDLPDEADPPVIQKINADADTVMWLNLASDKMNLMELTDYARRYLEDYFSTIDGVARIRIGGRLDYSMRIWLDRAALAARDLTVNDVEQALRAENVELPAGSIESLQRQFTVRVQRTYQTPEDFANLVLGRGEDGYLIRLRDVARVEVGPEQPRTLFRGNAIPMVGLGVIKQSTANTLDVARRVKQAADNLRQSLPAGMVLATSYDTSVFIEHAIDEVYQTIFITIALVLLVIYLFLGNIRAVLVPAVAVPISLIATFIVLYFLHFSINLFTLLALVLAIGLVVDDAIVVLENIYRRMEMGESALVASYLGTRQVGFAVIATTVILISVFIPIAFVKGDIGRLFTEFAFSLSAAVAFSSVVALSLSPMLASKFITRTSRQGNRMTTWVNQCLKRFRITYSQHLRKLIHRPKGVFIAFFAMFFGIVWLLQQLPTEFVPPEDRGSFFIAIEAPEGSSFAYMAEQLDLVEQRLMPLVESGEVQRLLIRAPRAFNTQEYHRGIVIVVLSDWAVRRPMWDIMAEVNKRLADVPGVRATPLVRPAFDVRNRNPVQFVIGGSSYVELVKWRDILLEKARENPNLVNVDYDYKETAPQLLVSIDQNRAGDLGISMSNINRTLETMLGSRHVTTYIDGGEEYNVIVEGETASLRSPVDLTNIYVRSERSGRLIPISNVVNITELADASILNRYNRMRAITIEAGLAPGYNLGEALQFLEKIVDNDLPEQVLVDYKGESLKYKESGASAIWVFGLALVVAFLVLAAQFESYIHPFVIMFTVPLAVIGALTGLWLTGQSLNIYSQISLVMLIGLATKNGILIVEFINQLRDQGKSFNHAVVRGAAIRLRPIIMTGLTTAMGAVPLILAMGAGSESRFVIGVVILSGVLVSTFFTLYVVPVAYRVFARHTGSPGRVKRQLEAELLR